MNESLSLVFLHGWGGDSRIWEPLCTQLGESSDLPTVTIDLPGFGSRAGEPWPDDETLLADIAARLPGPCVLVGHSLGGMLALRLAAHEARDGNGKIRGLCTIGANASFVGREQWPGMEPRVFEQFCRGFAADPAATQAQFCGLQARGDRAMRPVMKQLKQWIQPVTGPAWGRALEVLGRWDNRALIAGWQDSRVPALHLLGEGDALVPVAAAAELRALGADARVLEGAGHMPQLSCPGLVAKQLCVFLQGIHETESDGAPFDKRAVARSFGRAASSYDRAAHLQRAVCRQLLGRLETSRPPQRILDLGSGTGYGCELLRRRYPDAEIIALDLAEGMLDYARRERPVADHYIAADAEFLPLADASVDLVFSSMALQWCYRLPGLFAELRRVLADNGSCQVATLGPGTLDELRRSWAAVDGGVHVNRFLPAGDWLAAARGAGLSGALKSEGRVLHFDTVMELMRELKTIGAHNVNRDAGRGLTGRARLQALAEAYEQWRTPAGLPASYELLYLDLEAGQASKNKTGAGCTAGARRMI
ncbi:malonyl-ACP O-methyltransferase BioC [Microbulbifer sp. M83]|uniref:malonyl-ACP O-methyltransferase BioC n=1 Tax=unclassified Microbulbifer TaxID=2619833 RepID=UPI002FE3DC18